MSGEVSGVMWLVLQAYYGTRRAIDDALRPYGVTAAQLGALNRLAEQPGLTGAEIARQLLTTPQAVHLQLGALEARGLIVRRPDPNHGRLVRSSLTDEGVRVVAACRPAIRAVDERLVGVFSAKERAMVRDLLTRYVDNATSED